MITDRVLLNAGSGSTSVPPFPDLAQLDRQEVGHLMRQWQALLVPLGIGGTPLSRGRVGRQGEVILKREDKTGTGSYKERGAATAVLNAKARGYDLGVAASTGNFGRGIRAACEKCGFSATIFVPTSTPGNKVDALRGAGVTVKPYGSDFTEAHREAVGYAAVHPDHYLLEPYNSVPTILGQGTVALELIDQTSVDDYSVIFVPIGGGGLVAGTALGHFAFRKNVRVVGVCTEAAPASFLSFKLGAPVEVPTQFSIASGANVAKLGDICYPLIKTLVSDILLVREAEVERAISWLAARGIRAEGAGAMALAAVLRRKGKDHKVAAIVSGGSISEADHSKVLARVAAFAALSRRSNAQSVAQRGSSAALP